MAATARAASSGMARMWASLTSRRTAAWWPTPLVSRHKHAVITDSAPVPNYWCGLGQRGNIWVKAEPPLCDCSVLCVLLSFFLRHAGSPDGGLYIAFNSSHRPAVVDLPRWHGRRWQLTANSGKVGVLLGYPRIQDLE